MEFHEILRELISNDPECGYIIVAENTREKESCIVVGDGITLFRIGIRKLDL